MLSNKNFLNCLTFQSCPIPFHTVLKHTGLPTVRKEDLKLLINTDLKVRLSLAARKSHYLKVTIMRNEDKGSINFVVVYEISFLLIIR